MCTSGMKMSLASAPRGGASRISGVEGPHVTDPLAAGLARKHRAETVPPQPDRALVRALCVAREWRRRLEAGEMESTRGSARHEGFYHRHT